MLKILFALLCLTLTTTAHADEFHPEAANDLAKDGFWAVVNFEGTNTITTFRARYDFPAENVFEVLTDTANMARNHKGNYYDARSLDKTTFDKVVAAKPQSVEELQKLLGETRLKSGHNRQKGGKWTDYTYSNFNFPWPLSNRWTVNKIAVTEAGSKAGTYRFEFKMYVGNFKTTDGYWELVPGPDGSTEFRGVYRSDPGISLPRFATKLGTKMAMKREYDENKALLKRMP